jgi:endonuclease/exonuclease/phosphatase family metal-dependent hydrolase
LTEAPLAEKITDHLLSVHPDIICLQEVSYYSTCQKLIERLQQNSGLKYFYSDFNLTYKSKKVKSGNGQVILSRYPLFDYEELLKIKATSNGAFSIKAKIGRDTLSIINAHFQSIGLTQQEIRETQTLDNKDMREYKNSLRKFRYAFPMRGRQVDEVKAKIDKIKRRVILCGDFNDTPLSYTYSTLCNNLQDAWLKGGFGLGSTYAGNLPFLRIDYILLSHSLQVQQCKVMHWPESDHYALMCDIKII